MKLLLCLLAALSVARAQYNEAALYTLEDIRNLADSIEASTRDLYDGINTLTALNALATGRIQDVQDFFLPSIALMNSQQSERGESYTVQIKNMQHRVDEALSQAAASTSLAEITRDDLFFQINDYLNGSQVADVNDAQADVIANLTEEAAIAKQVFLDNLNDTLDDLEINRDAVEAKIDILAEFIDNRRCVAGQGSFPPDTATDVTFPVPFDEPPSFVSISVTGFETDLDVHSYDQYDGIALDKYVSNVSAEGFTVETQDKSEGMVQVTRIFCSYLACQGISPDDIVEIHP